MRNPIIMLATLAALLLPGISSADDVSTFYATTLMSEYRKASADYKDSEILDCAETPLKARKDQVKRNGECIKFVRGPFEGPQGGHVKLYDYHALSIHGKRGYHIVWTKIDNGAVPLASVSPMDALEKYGNKNKEKVVGKEKTLSAGFTRQFRYIQSEWPSGKVKHCLYLTGSRNPYTNLFVMSCGETLFSDEDLDNLKQVMKSIK